MGGPSDDAGHNSSSITDQYIDVELQARAASAKKKIILSEESSLLLNKN